MSKQWVECTLGDVLAELKNGLNCKQDKSGRGDRISRIESVSDGTFDDTRVGFAILTDAEKQRYRLKRGDILFSHINSPPHVGKIAIFESDTPVFHGVNLLLMRPFKEVDPKFLFYSLVLLRASGYWEENCKKSVNQASVNQKDIAKVSFRYPQSLEEQQRIVAVLDEAFAAIATATANAEKNLANARELFESAARAVFHESRVTNVKFRLIDICVLQRGFDLPTKDRAQGEIPLVSSSGIIDHVNELKVCGPGVVTGRSGSIGGVFYVEDDFWPLNTTLYVKDFHENNPRMVYHLLRQFGLSRYASGTGVPTLNRNAVHEEIVYAPKAAAEQTAIATYLDALEADILELEEKEKLKILNLTELRKSILERAFSGELAAKSTDTVTA